jgi:hypothetical protein
MAQHRRLSAHSGLWRQGSTLQRGFTRPAVRASRSIFMCRMAAERDNPAVRLAFVNDRFWEARQKSVGISQALNIWHNRTMGDLLEF